MIQALRLLGVKPKIESPEQMVRLSEVLGGGVKEEEIDTKPMMPLKLDTGARPKTPRVSTPHTLHQPDFEEHIRTDRGTTPSDNHESTHRSYSYPKIAIFYGEKGKGEVTWETFKFEVESLLAEKYFSRVQIRLQY